MVWQGNYDPFGACTETVNLVEQNIRFPGQYFDQETGLHYNYFRTYNPGTGRYVESDPVGLAGGINTYGYAFQNPLVYYDPDGRIVIAVPIFTAAFGAFVSGGATALQGGSFRDVFNSAVIGGVSGALGGIGFGARGASVAFNLRGNSSVGGVIGAITGNLIGSAITGIDIIGSANAGKVTGSWAM